MRVQGKFGLVVFVAALCLALPTAAVEKQTVCTVTVNSADEKETFRRYLPESKVRFVELVERGRPDWLASACRAQVACDVLVVSGHYDGGNSFFSDQLDVREYLPVSELERVSCSDSCPALFAHLKEVHLYGCNTLNPDPQSSASAEVIRGLVREGQPAGEARRQLQSLTAAHGESSRDRMRQIFKDVPVIYGFSSVAPLGPVAASTLSRYFRASGAGEIASGHASGRLLGYFAPFSLAVTQGMTDRDPHIDARNDMCQFADDRLPDAAKLGFVHQVLQRHMGEARLYLDRIQRLVASFGEPVRHSPAVAQARSRIARDAAARSRFLEFARAAEPPEVRVRLVNLARDLGWLSPDERWSELALMLGELQGRAQVGVPEVGLACSLNQEGDLNGAFNRRVMPGSVADSVSHAALRACLGSSEGHARTLAGLVSRNDAEVQIAQAYLRHRPIADADELRRVAAEVVRMDASEAQARALEALGRHYLSDRGILDMLTQLFARTTSAAVQSAIAGILIRADRRSIGNDELLATLLASRRRSPGDGGLVDALISTLQSR